MSSRESDSAYPSPRQGGRRPEGSPEAYPSGTPPYGTGLPDGGPQGAAPEEDLPKTETTLTTRVRINIPGSRPIPPVVVRSTVKNEEPAAEPASPRHRSATGSSPVHGMVDPGTRPSTPDLPAEWQQPEAAAPAPAPASSSESTGEWFRPRQKAQSQAGPVPAAAGAQRPAAAPNGGQGGGQNGGQGGPVPTGAPASPFGGDTGSHPLPQTPPPAATNPYGNDPFATQRPAAQNGAAAAGRGAFEGGQGTAGRDAFGGRQGGPRGEAFTGGPGERPGQGDPNRPGQGGPNRPGQGAPGNRPGQGGPYGPQGGSPYPGPQGGHPGNDPFATGGPAPRDPFAGQGRPGPEATRELRMPPGGADPFAGQGRPGAEATRQLRMPQGEPEDTQIGGFEPVREDTAAIPGLPTANRFGASARTAPPAADPFNTGAPAADPFGTAAPKPPAGGGRFAEHAFEPAPPFPGSVGNGATPPPVEIVPEPDPDVDDEPATAKRRPSKAPKLAAYAVGGLLFAGAAAYGTGLMLNQADIPKGTTVLGTDIGGDARDQAVSVLDGSVGKIGQRPIRLKVGAQTVNLDPATAGLSFDTTATVDSLTAHSYNPVDVISSIAGGSKAVAPEVKVDRAKLKAALDALGSSAGQGLQEGFVRFTTDGQTEVVPGKPGQKVDGAAAVDQVEQAYRDRAEGKPDTVLTVPVTAAQPKVGQDALQAAADGLGKQVLAGTVTVYAGTKRFDFGKTTAANALTLVPDASGKVSLKWDLDKLNDALKGVFDRSKTKKNGALAPITPQDVADGIASVLGGTTAKERTFRFPA